jgi:hypothetical protein
MRILTVALFSAVFIYSQMFKLVLIALVACTAEAAGNGTRILIMGDSWGTVSPATEHFEKELKEHR